MSELRPGFLDIPEPYAVYRNNVSEVQNLKLHSSQVPMWPPQSNRYTYFAGKPVKGVAMCEHLIESQDLSSRS